MGPIFNGISEAPSSIAMTSAYGGKMKEVGVAVAKEGPFDARLHGQEFLFRPKNLVVIAQKFVFKVF